MPLRIEVKCRRWIVVAVIGALLGEAVMAAEADDWYVITIAGSPVGSVHSRLETVDGETIERQEMHVILNRMGSRTEMATSTETREDDHGRLLAASMDLDMSRQTTTLRALVEDGHVRIADGVGEASFHRVVDYEGDLLGPNAARALIRTALVEPGDRVAYQTFRPDLGLVVDVTLELEGVDEDLLVVEETITGVPIATTYRLDQEAKVVQSTTPSPFGPLETVLTDAATARMATAGNQLPQESYGASLARTQVRIPEPRRASGIVLEIRHRTPQLGWPDLDGPNQEVIESSAESLWLEVRREAELPAASFPVARTPELAEYLDPNAYIQSDDPEVRALALEIVGDANDIASAVEALKRWTAETMEFDMGVVMAPSSEVLENRRGTCTEYAVLLTTLARSLGIPSRFVMGYVYVGGIYGGHAWTEVRIGDRWVGFDAAVPSVGPVDAARLAFLWSSLAQGIGSLSVGPGMQMYGQIDLAVLEVEWIDGETRTFAVDDDQVEIDGNVYRNEALGVVWSTPLDFHFGGLDLTWPDTGLVTAEATDDTTATLSVRDRRYWLDATREIDAILHQVAHRDEIVDMTVSGRPARQIQAGPVAALALVRGSELWVLEVEGVKAGERLDRLAAGLKL